MFTLLISLLSFTAGGALMSLVYRAQINAYRRYTWRLRHPAYAKLTVREVLEIIHNGN